MMVLSTEKESRLQPRAGAQSKGGSLDFLCKGLWTPIGDQRQLKCLLTKSSPKGLNGASASDSAFENFWISSEEHHTKNEHNTEMLA